MIQLFQNKGSMKFVNFCKDEEVYWRVYGNDMTINPVINSFFFNQKLLNEK